MLQRRLREKEQQKSAANICKSNNYGEWFLIYKLAQNMDQLTFGDLVEDIDLAFRKWDESHPHHDDEEMALHAPAPPPSVMHSPVHVHSDLMYG